MRVLSTAATLLMPFLLRRVFLGSANSRPLKSFKHKLKSLEKLGKSWKIMGTPQNSVKDSRCSYWIMGIHPKNDYCGSLSYENSSMPRRGRSCWGQPTASSIVAWFVSPPALVTRCTLGHEERDESKVTCFCQSLVAFRHWCQYI